MIKLWELGADTVILDDLEMKRVRNIVENPTIADALEQVIDLSRGDLHPPSGPFHYSGMETCFSEHGLNTARSTGQMVHSAGGYHASAQAGHPVLSL